MVPTKASLNCQVSVLLVQWNYLNKTSKLYCNVFLELRLCEAHFCASVPHSTCLMYSGKRHCECVHSCELNAEVCGTDGVTYKNECELKKKACSDEKHIHMAKQQPCPGQYVLWAYVVELAWGPYWSIVGGIIFSMFMIYGPSHRQGPWTCQKELHQYGPHNLVQLRIYYNGCF